jgi:hypothetical protein
MRSLTDYALAFLQAPTILSNLRNISDRCSANVLARPDLFGADMIHLSAHPVTGYSSTRSSSQSKGTCSLENNDHTSSGLNFCNVTVTYTHPGQHDTIHVNIWLPLENWNGRFLAAGGGGWITGSPSDLIPAVELNYAAASTDGGHALNRSSTSWALSSPGNVNWNALQNFAYRSLDDLAVIGKAITTSFYQRPPEYSYWSGCSTGGRQGLMLAQRSPRQFDGILAAAPAIEWPTFVISAFWARQRMNRLRVDPAACELKAFINAAIEACDGLDGLVDGIIGAPGLCHFDPQALVGSKFDCAGDEKVFTSAGATIIQAAWTGPITAEGKAVWFGVNQDAMLGMAADTSEGARLTIPEEWISLFVNKDPSYNTANMTDAEYFAVLKASQREYDSIMATNWADLSEFRDAGGKMITWHGLADSRIPPNGTSNYYKQVLEQTANVSGFYRYFEAPGVGHCAGGLGPAPLDALGALVEWVERGVEPDTLRAVGQDGDGTVRHLCLYPLVQRYVGGDPKVAESFECATGF